MGEVVHQEDVRGKTWNDVGWELNAFQDIECLSRQIVRMGTTDDLAVLDALEAFSSALQAGRLDKSLFEHLKATLSIGTIRCIALSDDEAPSPIPAATTPPKRRPAPRKTSGRSVDSNPRQTKA